MLQDISEKRGITFYRLRSRQRNMKDVDIVILLIEPMCLKQCVVH